MQATCHVFYLYSNSNSNQGFITAPMARPTAPPGALPDPVMGARNLFLNWEGNTCDGAVDACLVRVARAPRFFWAGGPLPFLLPTSRPAHPRARPLR